MAAEPQLTPACELAFAVARQGIDASPVVEAPVALRPFLDSRPPSRRALRAAHRALDADAAFRSRVAAQAATDDFVGRAGWLFLHRPGGWDAELAHLTGRYLIAEAGAGRPTAPDVAGGADATDGAELGAGEVEVPLDPDEADVEVAPVTEVADAELAPTGADPGAEIAMDVDAAPSEDGPVADGGVASGADAVEPAAGLERELHALRSLVEGLVADGSVLAGATIRQLEEQVAALTAERDELAGALAATTADRDRALAQVAATGDRLTTVDARLAHVTAARSDAEDRLARALTEHADALAARQAQAVELAGHLAQAEAERVALVAELARTSAHVADVRVAFERAVHQAADEVLGSLEPSLSATTAAVDSIASSVEQARLGTERLAGDLAPGVRAPAGRAAPDVSDHLDAPYRWDQDATPDGLLGGITVEAAPSAQAAPDPIAGELSDFSKDLSDALAPYFAEPIPTIATAAGPLERALPGWLDHGEAPADGGGSTGPDLAGDAGPAVEAARTAWTNPSQQAHVARRPVEVPGDLLDDALSAARFLASVPDVVLLIDGDAVAALGWPTLTVAEQRDALVSYLGDLAGSSGAAADVVFGGDVGDSSTLPLSDLVRVRLTSAGVPTDRAVVELIDTYPVNWPVVVVGGADELAAEAGRAGAAVLSAMGLLDLFIAP